MTADQGTERAKAHVFRAVARLGTRSGTAFRARRENQAHRCERRAARNGLGLQMNHCNIKKRLLLYCFFAVSFAFTTTGVFATEQESDVLRVHSNCIIRVWGFRLPWPATERLSDWRRSYPTQNFSSGNWDNYFAVLTLDGFNLYVEQLGSGCFEDYYRAVQSGWPSEQTNNLGMKFGAVFQKMPVRATWFSGFLSSSHRNAPDYNYSLANVFHFSTGVLDSVSLLVSDFRAKTIEGADLVKFVQDGLVYDVRDVTTNRTRCCTTCPSGDKGTENLGHDKVSPYVNEVFLEEF